MRITNDTVVPGRLAGRARDWIRVTTATAPTAWLATADGLVLLDLLAIELAVNGLRTDGWRLTGPETAYAADVLLQRGMDRMRIARLIGIDRRTLRSWFPTHDTPLAEALTRVLTQAEWSQVRAQRRDRKPPAQCGTYQAAQRHRSRREPLDEACRWARNAGDRHYREHGTYIGAPVYPGSTA